VEDKEANLKENNSPFLSSLFHAIFFNPNLQSLSNTLNWIHAWCQSLSVSCYQLDWV
jgi:hypothetical protein